MTASKERILMNVFDVTEISVSDRRLWNWEVNKIIYIIVFKWAHVVTSHVIPSV